MSEQCKYLELGIPVSGGKDSTYQTYVIKKEFGLDPLVVNFHPHDLRDLGRENLENLKKIGVDCIEFSANPILLSDVLNTISQDPSLLEINHSKL